MNKKEKYKIILIAALFVAVIFLAALIFYGKKINISRLFIENSDREMQDIFYFENKVVFWDDDLIKKIDIETGKVEEASLLEKEDFSGFSGLPKFGKNGNREISQNLVIPSKDKSKAIVIVIENDLTAEPSAFSGLQPVVSTSEFTCDIAKKKCESAKLLSQDYSGLDANLQKPDSPLWFVKWDSKKNLLYGHLSGDGVGNASPVFVCETQEKKCNQTQGFNSLNDREIRAVVPEGSFSPSFGKFVMINQHDKTEEETGKIWEFLIYDSNDLTKPQKNFNVSSIIDHSENVSYDGIRSVAWSADEKKIAIGTTRRIFLMDTETGSLTLAHITPTDEDGNFYWDFNALFLSPDAKSIVFVDSIFIEDENIDSDEDDTSISSIKRIDLENGNKVEELLRGPGLVLK